MGNIFNDLYSTILRNNSLIIIINLRHLLINGEKDRYINKYDIEHLLNKNEKDSNNFYDSLMLSYY